jgi:hypothetical protein
MRKDGWTDMTKLIVSFRKFANAPKKAAGRLHSCLVLGRYRVTTWWPAILTLQSSARASLLLPSAVKVVSAAFMPTDMQPFMNYIAAARVLHFP